VNIFISYRRTDAPSASRAVADALRQRFGRDEVFLDTQDVHAGDHWRDDVVRRVSAADVVVAVIGPHWTSAVREHIGRTVLDPAAEDVLRLEVETALRRDKLLIPVLVEGAAMPPSTELPPVFRPLTDVQATPLRHESWERDCEAFADDLVERANRFHRDPPAPRKEPPRPRRNGRTGASRAAWYMAQGSLVTILGPGANAADRSESWAHGAASLPDTAELARHLSVWFELEHEGDDLARVSQHVSLSEGRADLCRTLHDLLVNPDAAPTSVHRFLAAAPGQLRELGREAYQLLVTTSYDDALERAFDEIREPYDLVVFVGAKGPYQGRFVHVPYDADPPECRPIRVPNEYVDLPIDDRLELTRTIIVKLHGGTADLGREWRSIRDNFVITEDDYIGYLTESPVEGLVPVQILDKMRESHFLFLGYGMRDWTRRVFLQRVWGDRLESARSMAVDPDPDPVERDLWEDFGVHVVEQRPTEFLDELEEKLAVLAVAPAER
jgi:hypothetical protein